MNSVYCVWCSMESGEMWWPPASIGITGMNVSVVTFSVNSPGSPAELSPSTLSPVNHSLGKLNACIPPKNK